MIEYRKGNIWDVIDSGEAQAIVIPVNTVGVMGAGLAKQAKERGYEEDYFECIEDFDPEAGGLIISAGAPTIAFYAFTKRHWRNKSKIEWIEKILNTISQYTPGAKYPVIALPALGCGLGGLKWEDVKPLCEKYLADSPTKFLVFEPQ